MVTKERGEYGYLKEKKRKDMIHFLILVLIAALIFVAGIVVNKMLSDGGVIDLPAFLPKKEGSKPFTIGNIFMIVSIVMVLPAARVLVSIILCFPYKTLDEAKMQELEALKKPGDKTMYDMVFTSSKHVMHLNAIFITGKKVFGYTFVKSDNEKTITDYFNDEFRSRKLGYTVYITKDLEAFKNKIGTITKEEAESAAEGEERKTVEEFIRISVM